MATILITHGIPLEGFDALRGHRLLAPAPRTAFSREELFARLPECEAVVAGGAVDAEMITAGQRLKIIANYGAGYDQVDAAAAARLGVPVTNIPDAVTESTAEMAFALMLAVCRRVGENTLRMRTGAPEALFGMGRNMGRNLQGLTLGILGAGRIGTRMACLGRAFGMRPIGYSRHGANAAEMEPVGLDELLHRADVLSLHCPLTKETRGIIGREALAKMKPGAVLINTARGAVVDVDALCDAVEAGQIFGAGLDVYPDEPHVSPRLLALPQIVLTPHSGCNTEQTRKCMAQACAAQIMDALAGRRPAHIVNGL